MRIFTNKEYRWNISNFREYFENIGGMILLTVYIFQESTPTPVGKMTKKLSKEMLSRLKTGDVAAGVFSLSVGGAGLNAQKFNTLIFMSPCSSQYLEEQGKGNILLLIIY